MSFVIGEIKAIDIAQGNITPPLTLMVVPTHKIHRISEPVTSSPGISRTALILRPSFSFHLRKAEGTALARAGDKTQYFGTRRTRVMHKTGFLIKNREHHRNTGSPLLFSPFGIGVPTRFVIKDIADIALAGGRRISTAYQQGSPE